MVLIYPNTPAKQKDYQDQIVKTFYLTTGTPRREGPAQDDARPKTLFVDDKAN